MYVVVGANGYMGAYMIKNIQEKTSDHIVATYRSGAGYPDTNRVSWVFCDTTDEASVNWLNDTYFAPHSDIKVIYLAAYHHPDLVEKNPRTAWNTNVTALSKFINTIKNVACFVYPSTDTVYGESIDGYHFRETDALNPENFYGKNKIAAESITTCYGHMVVRYPFLIAPSLTGKPHFYDVIAGELQAGRPFEMFKDSRRSALDFNTAANLTVDLVEKQVIGNTIPQIFNVCGDEALSKYDIGLRIADKLGVSRELIRPISIRNTGGIFEAKRAANTLMDNSLLKETLSLKEVKLTL